MLRINLCRLVLGLVAAAIWSVGWAPASIAAEKIYEPVPVNVLLLKWHSETIPERLLEFRGFYSSDSLSGVPHIYMTKEASYMRDEASGFPVSFVLRNQVGPDNACDDGPVKAIGYLDRKHPTFWVFMLVPYDKDWQESEPCWITTFNWQEHPDYMHLLPDRLGRE